MAASNISYTRYTCDRCNKDWTDPGEKHELSGTVTAQYKKSGSAMIESTYQHDLCADCVSGLRNWWLTGGMNVSQNG